MVLVYSSEGLSFLASTSLRQLFALCVYCPEGRSLGASVPADRPRWSVLYAGIYLARKVFATIVVMLVGWHQSMIGL